MGSTDAFDVGDVDTSTADGTISDSTVEYKYAQMVVPKFQVVDAVDGTGETISWSSEATPTPTTPSGSSFIRLGSFPVTATPTLNGSTYTYTMTTDPNTDAPSGFTESLELAKLVGDVSAVTTAQSTDDSTSTGRQGVFTDDGGDPFKGNKMRGFVDDTRIRDDAASTNLYIKGSSGTDSLATNSTANRKTETRRLLTKGGWWDHSDGNRISTTAGDKVEVIQGNYKLVVLGRRKASDTGDIKVTDISGGYEFSKTYEYLEDDKIWATYEESSAKHATKVSSGKEVTYFTGTLKKTITGEDPSGAGLRGPNTDKDPEIISRTWAKSMETYVGSAEKPVPHVFALSWSGTREEVTMSAEIAIGRFAAGNFTQVSTSTISIFDVKAAPILWSVNVAGWLVKADFAKLVNEIKTGNVISYNTTKSFVTTHYIAFKGVEAKATAKKEELTALKEELSAAKRDLSLQQTNISNQVQSLSTQFNQIAIDSKWGAVMHVMY